MREIKFRAWDGKKMDRVRTLWLQFVEKDWYIPGDKKYEAIMQYTGLKDKNGVAEVYEGDIIDTYGNIKGNIYEMDKRETDLVIQGFGTSSWEATNKEAMARGLKYSE